MQTLYLVRHAKASKEIYALKDNLRPLTERGYRDAYFVAKKLRKKKIKPDLIISSPALRAISTALIFAAQLKYPYKEICIDEKIYSDNYKDILKVIGKQKETTESIMLFGHNPSFEETANYLCEKPIQQISTCGVLCLETLKSIGFEKQTMKNIFYFDPKSV